MSFPRYPAYKDSGVEWLGEVPGHWEISQLKHAYSVIGGSTPSSGVPQFWDGDIVWVTPADLSRLKSFKIVSSLRTITDAGLASCGTNLLPVGSIVLSTRAPIGSLGVAGTELCTNQGCKGLVPKSEQCSGFGAYLLAVMGGELNIRGRGTTFLELSSEALCEVKIPLPPEPEQGAIAAFLDRETAKIDALVAEQQDLIALLKEKRQALISHAVTKGLDPDVPMKDSGVAWLGEVPAHWLVTPLKYLASSIKAGPFGSALTKDMYVAAGYRVYGQEQVIPGDFTVGDYYISDGVFDELSQYAVAPGDLLISCVGTFGKIAIVPDDVEPGIINPRLIRLRVRSDVKAGFLCEVLRSQVVFEQFAVLSRGGTMDVINIGTLSNIYVPCPPLEEQQRILSFLAKSLLGIDSLVAEADATIALLQERRTALISAAVTGKIDVRHLAPTPEPA
ncbi:MAG: restriction endonuclease subunit S [Thauera sp.]|nr:restriction endonuclease subunit S [Thauera sp.]